MGEKAKKRLLIFVFTILLLPFVQQCFPFISSGELYGYYTNAANVDLSWEKWINGTYEKGKADFCNDHIGFRPDLLRLNNQIDFSFFGKTHSSEMGHERYLFQSPYIDAYYGEDFVGYQAILATSVKLKAIQDTLNRLGKSLILVYAASKASFFPEYFPEDRKHEKRGVTNYQTYRHLADSLGINQLDMDSWFVSMKNHSREALFSKQGIHWTEYGAMLAADSLIKYIERLRNVHIPHAGWSQVERTELARYDDNDLGNQLNLIFPITKETFSYPVIQKTTDTTGKKLKAIYIGDSYGTKVVQSEIIVDASAQCTYFFYFGEVHDIKNDKFNYVPKGYDWAKDVDTTDCVVLFYTAQNLGTLGSGFIEAAYDRYYPSKT